MTAANVLREHIGHRAVLRDERHLRCVDCNRTVVLPVGAATTTATSTSPAPPQKHERCPLHIAGTVGACSGCAADAKAAPDPYENGLTEWVNRTRPLRRPGMTPTELGALMATTDYEDDA